MMGDPNVMRGIAVGNITEGIRDAGSNAAGAMTRFMGVGMGMNAFNSSMDSKSDDCRHAAESADE